MSRMHFMDVWKENWGFKHYFPLILSFWNVIVISLETLLNNLMQQHEMPIQTILDKDLVISLIILPKPNRLYRTFWFERNLWNIETIHLSLNLLTISMLIINYLIHWWISNTHEMYPKLTYAFGKTSSPYSIFLTSPLSIAEEFVVFNTTISHGSPMRKISPM